MFFKFLFDRAASLFGLIFLSLVLLIVGILIRVKCLVVLLSSNRKEWGGTVNYLPCINFVSMMVSHSGSSVSVKGESRITPLGAKLRKYKLDELPELWNVLIGD